MPSTVALPNVAAVLSGEIRAFVLPEVHMSIRKNVLDALCPTPSACKPEVFACPSRDNCPPYSYWSRSSVQLRAAGPTTAKLLAATLRSFSSDGLALTHVPASCANLHALLPTCFSDSQASELCSAATSGVQSRCRNTVRSAGSTSAAAHLLNETVSLTNVSAWGNVGHVNAWRCYQQVKARERERGVLFDWIVRLRFDVAFFEPLPSLLVLTLSGRGVYVADNHERTFADQFALIAREFADAYFDSTQMRCCTSVNRCLTRLIGSYFLPQNPEQGLQASLWVRRVPVKFGYIPWVLVRQAGRGHTGAVANCYVHKECCAHNGKQRVFGASCMPPCPSIHQRLERCEALLGLARTCVNVSRAPSGFDQRLRVGVAGVDWNKVDVCDLHSRARSGRNASARSSQP
jgi:hypothetical protein